MSNHVHLIAVPHRPQSLPAALKLAHGRYAAYWNARTGSSGHAWQCRYYSCPLSARHLWAALRYAENNPVRAGLCAVAEHYRWSSAPLHCGHPAAVSCLDLGPWQELWAPHSWQEYLASATAAEEAETIRRSTHTGRPLGDPGFVHQLEISLARCLTPKPVGRPARQPLLFARAARTA
jgi:putative transposase